MFWEDTRIDKSLAPGNDTQDSLVGGIPEDEIKGMTLTRLLMNLTLTATTAGTGSRYAAGIYLAEEDAFAAGAVADPEQEGDDPGWVWRVFQIPIFSSDPNDYAQTRHFILDLRAQRKFPGEDTALILTQTNEGGVSTINSDGIIRCLYKRA